MPACCVSGCKNRHSSTSILKFYRIPSGNRPFQANRRRLWLQAIHQVNGSTEQLKGNARICGAHFISGEASMDHDSPDFVPSVFTCTKQSKKKVKWFYGRRKRRRRTANVKEGEEKTSPTRVDSVFMEEKQKPSSKEREPLTKKAVTETETSTIKSQTTYNPNKPSPSFKLPAGIPKLDKMIPIVLLKSVFAPAGGYQCELCNQKFTIASQLVKHKQLHEEKRSFMCDICGKLFTSQADLTASHQCVIEPSFPCNMCDRSFTTNHNLKRHKLLHVKDGRKCQKCGILFCRRHNHILFQPQTESEQDSSVIAPQQLDSDLMPENSLLEKPEPNQTADLDGDSESTMAVRPLQTTTVLTASSAPPKTGPLSKTLKTIPPASHTKVLSEIPVPVLIKPSSVPRPPPPLPRFSRNDYPATIIQPRLPQHLELPPSLKIFSPQYLTSALLEVKRNYEYILSKPRGVKDKKDTVKEEQHELPLIPPNEQSIEHNKKERTAYDLEIIL